MVTEILSESPGCLRPLRIRQTLGRDAWSVPLPFGDGGWKLLAVDGRGSVIVTAAVWDHNGERSEWIHASIARDRMPDYTDLQQLHRAVWHDGFAYQVFAPPTKHVNIHNHALHLWGRADGADVLPDFGYAGTI